MKRMNEMKFSVGNRLIRNLVLDVLTFKKLLELPGKSYKTLALSVPSVTVSEIPFPHGFLKISSTVCFLC